MKVSIIGAAGVVGSATAYTLLERDLVDQLVLLDTNATALTSHVWDLQYCRVYHPRCEVIAGDYPDAEGSDVVILCASVSPWSPGITSRLHYLEANKVIFGGIIERLSGLKDIGVIITASNPADVLNYLVFRRGKWGREQLFGFSSNDTDRLRYYTAAERRVSPDQVTRALAIGEHGASQIPLYRDVEVRAQGALSEEEIARIKSEIDGFYSAWRSLGPGRTLGWLSAQGIARMVADITGDGEKVVPCSVVLDGEFGLRDLSIGVPAVVGRGRLIRVAQELIPQDYAQQLAEVAQKLRPFMEQV